MGEKASIYTEHLFAYLNILGFSQRIATAPESQIKRAVGWLDPPIPAYGVSVVIPRFSRYARGG